MMEILPYNIAVSYTHLAFGGAFFSAFTMFNWWLGYKLFTRSQVIKPKFRLL